MFETLLLIVVVACCGAFDARAESIAPPQTSSSTASSGTAIVATPKARRLFVARLVAGAGADKAVVDLLEERVLVALRKQGDFDIMAARDLQAFVDVEAAKQAAGCDSASTCASEIAEALDAPELITGQLGRIGNTWVLTLTRTDHATVTVRARVVREHQGETPEGLLTTIDSAVAEVMHVEVATMTTATRASAFPFGWLGAGVGAGALLSIGAGSAYALKSWSDFTRTKQQLQSPTLAEDEAQRLRATALETGNRDNILALSGWALGGVLVATACTLVAIEIVTPPAPQAGEQP